MQEQQAPSESTPGYAATFTFEWQSIVILAGSTAIVAAAAAAAIAPWLAALVVGVAMPMDFFTRQFSGPDLVLRSYYVEKRRLLLGGSPGSSPVYRQAQAVVAAYGLVLAAVVAVASYGVAFGTVDVGDTGRFVVAMDCFAIGLLAGARFFRGVSDLRLVRKFHAALRADAAEGRL